MLISVPTEDAYLVFSCLNAPLSFSAGISVIVCAVVFYVTDNNMVLAWPCVTICQWPRAVLRAGERPYLHKFVKNRPAATYQRSTDDQWMTSGIFLRLVKG
jgi:hypothetical protein